MDRDTLSGRGQRMILIGRERDQQRVAAALAASRVVVLVGPAGIGKSALAASFCVDRPVLWIDGRASLAPAALAGSTTGRRDLAELVVIDGVVPEEDPDRIMELVQGFAVPVLLTGRRELGADLVHVPVGPLDPTAGAVLLRQHITGPGRSATLPTNELVRLSAALGGVPRELCDAARQLELLDVANLLEADPPAAGAAVPSQVRRSVVEALTRLQGPVTTRLLSALAGADARVVVAELVAEGVAEVFPSGAPTVRLRPLAGAVEDGGEPAHRRLQAALAALLPTWERLAREVEHGGWRAQTSRLREDMPALQLLCTGDDVDLALRAACALGVLHQRVGPESRNLELDAALPAGGDPRLAACWSTFAAKAAVRAYDGPSGLAALDRRPAPAGTLEAVDHTSLRARLLEQAGDREEGARTRAVAVDLAAGTELEGDVRYRDAVSRYWTGDFDGALAGLDRTLAISNPDVHSLLVLKSTILRTLLRRELGADSADLLAQMLAVDPLWRRTECEEGPTALIITAALRADLEQWAEADAILAEATHLLVRLGRRDEAANQALQRASFVYVSGRVPALRLAEVLGLPSPEEVERRLAPFSKAELLGWRAVRAAALGQSARARVDLEAAYAAYDTAGRPLRAAELAAHVVAALIGAGTDDAELIDRLLPRVAGGPHLDHLHALLAHALGRGDEPTRTGPRRFEHHVLHALLDRRHGLQVAEDGSWFRAPDGAAVSLARKYVLKRALAALARTSRGLTLPELVVRTWPDKRFVGDSGRRRAEVAISNLRQLGLRDAVVTVMEPGGTRWRLDAVVVPG